MTGRKCAALVTARLASHVMSPCRAVLVLSVSSPAFGGRAGVGGWGGVAGVVGLLCRLRIATGEYLPPLRVEDDGGGQRKLQGEAEEVGRRPGEGVRESGGVEGPAGVEMMGGAGGSEVGGGGVAEPAKREEAVSGREFS